MPRPAKPSDPDKEYWLHVRIPGWLKNDILALSQQQNMDLMDWAAVGLYILSREQRKLPVRPDSRPLPTTADQIRLWAVGEKMLMPCGKQSCAYTPEVVGSSTFCSLCGIRTG